MENHFANLLEENTPKTNPVIMSGLACFDLKRGEEYLDRVLKLVAKTFPEGITYDGYEVCSPYEEFEEATRSRDAGRIYDISKSYIYTIKLYFSLNGEKIPPRYLYLPYCEDGGIILMNGSQFHITPVLSDKVISPGQNDIFVRILQNRLKFKRVYHTVVVNNIKENMFVVWCQIYKKPKLDTNKAPLTTKALTTMAHYLFSNYGFTETFKRYAGFVPVVGEEDINEENYPDTDWIICRSAHGENINLKPKTFISGNYKGTNIRLAIRKDKWNEITKGLVAGFYYVIDNFPSYFNVKTLDNNPVYVILMGHILYTGNYGYDVLHDLMEIHFRGLDGYLDAIAIDKLAERGYKVDNFYDLLALMISEFNYLITDTENLRSSVYDKSLEVLYYVFYNITRNIITTRFRLVKLANKRSLTVKDVTDMFKKNLYKRSIFTLTKGNIITEALGYSGDNMSIKITSKVTEQESLPGATKGKSKHAGPSEGMMLTSSMAEAGNVLYLGKKHCIPTNRINPFVNIDLGTGTILPHEEFKALIKKTEDLITGRINLNEEDLTSISNFNKRLELIDNTIANEAVLDTTDNTTDDEAVLDTTDEVENDLDDFELDLEDDIESE